MKQNKKEKVSIQEKMIENGKDPKKSFVLLALFDLLLIAGAAFLIYKKASGIIVMVLFGALVVGDYVYISCLLRGKKKDTSGLEKEFVTIFAYFGVYVKNGIPVYNALEGIVKFSSPEMENLLHDLLGEIDADKSVTPYINFASNFSSLTVKEVMISVYLMAEEGGSEAYLRQFSVLFDNFAAEEKKLEKEKRLNLLNQLTFLPLLGSGVTMIMITVGVVAVIGGLLSGI